MRAFKRLQN